jgi:succinate dehydrogenase/fumarate reductase flavoprotein subunit
VNTTSGTDHADIIIVGAGPGGCAAAVEAARHGASVILLEAGERVGGNAARSTAYVAFQGFDMQTEAGISDSVDAFMADMEAEIERQRERYGLIFDTDLARRFAEESSDTFRFLVGLGFRFNRFIRRPLQHTTDRMVDVVENTMFTYLFEPVLAELGVDVRTNTRAERLLNRDGAVVGVRAGGLELRADRGVILAAGGYQANPKLRARYQPMSMADTPYLGTEHDRGDGHLMGQAVGGDLINMTMIPSLIMVASALVEESIAVNRDGRRFHDEAGPYDDRVDALLAQPDRMAWYVFDDRVARAKGQLVDEMPEPAASAGTLEELAGMLGCDPGGLAESVREWNETVTSGATEDPAFGRVIFPDPRVGIVDAPFHASRMMIGINFPAGGFRVTTDTQVIDVYGDPIPGLFAVGDCAGGVSPTIGLGGMRISAALALGRVAGRTIATDSVRIWDEAEFREEATLPSTSLTIAVVDE